MSNLLTSLLLFTLTSPPTNTLTNNDSSNVKSLPTAEKLKHKNTQRPEICGCTVAFAQDNFRCHVAQCAAERPRLLTHLYPLQTSGANLRYTSIRSTLPRLTIELESVCSYQFAITLLIQNNVFRLDISKHDSSTVKKTQGLDNTSCVELGAAVVNGSPEK